MSETTYRPWRSEGEPITLATPAAKQWSELVEESRRSIVALRELREGVDERLAAGQKLVNTIDRQQTQAKTEVVVQSKAEADAEAAANAALDARLTVMEERLTALEQSIGRMGVPLTIRRDADETAAEHDRSPDPMQHLLGHLFNAAA